jgi:hypothetical protein
MGLADSGAWRVLGFNMQGVLHKQLDLPLTALTTAVARREK